MCISGECKIESTLIKTLPLHHYTIEAIYRGKYPVEFTIVIFQYT